MQFFDVTCAAAFSSRHLTKVQGKATYYSHELGYREALCELARAAGDVELSNLAQCIKRVGLGLFRPDAIAFDRVRPTLAYLAHLGLRPFYFEVLNIGPSTVRELWRYQLNAASNERLRLLDLVFQAAPSILTLFAGPKHAPLPCTVILSDVKGAASPSRRRGWELRSYLESPNRIEVYFHAADEPADVVREGAILLGPEKLAGAITGQPVVDVTSEVLARAEAITVTEDPVEDVVLQEALRETRRPGNDHDRWTVLRALAPVVPMFAAPHRNLIAETGSEGWWEDGGLLPMRARLAERVAGLPALPRLQVAHAPRCPSAAGDGETIGETAADDPEERGSL